jgi:hypothetical protein
MINNVARNNPEVAMKQRETHQIVDQGLYIVSKQYKKLIISFHSSSIKRLITIYFQDLCSLPHI